MRVRSSYHNMTNSQHSHGFNGIFDVFAKIKDLIPEIKKSWKDPKGDSIHTNIITLNKRYEKFSKETFEFLKMLNEAIKKGNSLLRE